MPISPEDTGEDSWTGIDLEQWIGGHRTDPIPITSIKKDRTSFEGKRDSYRNIGGDSGAGG